MTDGLTIRQLTSDDAEQMRHLRQEALASAPLAFGSSPDRDRFARKVDAPWISTP